MKWTNARRPLVRGDTRGGVATLEALSLGANDYMTKPANVGKVIEARETIRVQLNEKIKGLCPTEAPEASTLPDPKAPAKPTSKPIQRDASTHHRIDIVAIGVSTGGPNALAEDFPRYLRTFQCRLLSFSACRPSSRNFSAND